MHATSVYIAREQFLRHQTVERTQARSEDFHIRVVRALLHTRVFMKFKLSCTVCIYKYIATVCIFQKSSIIFYALLASYIPRPYELGSGDTQYNSMVQNEAV